jgi:1,4-alpha-glucan branching enzyme
MDVRQRIHPDWDTAIFNYGRNEVRCFLISSALFWLEKYHADGLRVDAVASMLYLDYSRKEGEWVPNQFGGRENLDAISFLRRLNEEIYRSHPDVQTIAEESTAWPGVSRPTYLGGLGFGMKWDMGWMHDTLHYFAKNPIHRKYHHNELTFRMIYAFHENFILPLSHDEVVHGKGSIFEKMPGDDWQRFASQRLMYAYMFTQPGKKLLFMGDEFAQYREWTHEETLDWALLNFHEHAGVAQLVHDLNRLYRSEPALHERDFDPAGFHWIDGSDSDNSVLSYYRTGKSTKTAVVAVCNFTPVPRHHHRTGVPCGGFWQEVVNTDAPIYGGAGVGNYGGFDAEAIPWHGQPYSLDLTLPPLGAVILRHQEP